MGFSRQEYWSGLPFPSPGDLPDPGIEPGSPSLEADTLTSEPPGKMNITVIQVYAPTSNDKEAEVEWFYEDLQDLLELTPKKDVLFIRGDWNAKVGSQELPGVMGKFVLRVQDEAGKRVIEFCRENALAIANTLFEQHKKDSTHGHHQMVDTKIRLIILLAAKDGKPLYS